MGTITNNKGEVVGTFEDTLEDWRQAAEVEAGIRREFQGKCERLRSALEALRDDKATPAWIVTFVTGQLDANPL